VRELADGEVFHLHSLQRVELCIDARHAKLVARVNLKAHIDIELERIARDDLNDRGCVLVPQSRLNCKMKSQTSTPIDVSTELPTASELIVFAPSIPSLARTVDPPGAGSQSQVFRAKSHGVQTYPGVCVMPCWHSARAGIANARATRNVAKQNMIVLISASPFAK
jgi:hypothetical protein